MKDLKKTNKELILYTPSKEAKELIEREKRKYVSNYVQSLIINGCVENSLKLTGFIDNAEAKGLLITRLNIDEYLKRVLSKSLIDVCGKEAQLYYNDEIVEIKIDFNVLYDSEGLPIFRVTNINRTSNITGIWLEFCEKKLANLFE